MHFSIATASPHLVGGQYPHIAVKKAMLIFIYRFALIVNYCMIVLKYFFSSICAIFKELCQRSAITLA